MVECLDERDETARIAARGPLVALSPSSLTLLDAEVGGRSSVLMSTMRSAEMVIEPTMAAHKSRPIGSNRRNGELAVALRLTRPEAIDSLNVVVK